MNVAHELFHFLEEVELLTYTHKVFLLFLAVDELRLRIFLVMSMKNSSVLFDIYAYIVLFVNFLSHTHAQ